MLCAQRRRKEQFNVRTEDSSWDILDNNSQFLEGSKPGKPIEIKVTWKGCK